MRLLTGDSEAFSFVCTAFGLLCLFLVMLSDVFHVGHVECASSASSTQGPSRQGSAAGDLLAEVFSFPRGWNDVAPCLMYSIVLPQSAAKNTFAQDCDGVQAPVLWRVPFFAPMLRMWDCCTPATKVGMELEIIPHINFLCVCVCVISLTFFFRRT